MGIAGPDGDDCGGWDGGASEGVRDAGFLPIEELEEELDKLFTKNLITDLKFHLIIIEFK